MLKKILCNPRQKAFSLNYLSKYSLSTKFDEAYFNKNNEIANQATEVLQKKFVYQKGITFLRIRWNHHHQWINREQGVDHYAIWYPSSRNGERWWSRTAHLLITRETHCSQCDSNRSNESLAGNPHCCSQTGIKRRTAGEFYRGLICLNSH